MPRVRWVMLVLAVAVGGCRGGDSETAASSTTSTIPPEIKVTAASVEVESMRVEPTGFPDEVRDAVVITLNAWIDSGVVAPLLTGQPAVGLDAAFSPTALGRLTPGTPDRAAMLEEGPSAALQPEKASASLVGLADENGGIGLVTASVEVSFVQVSGVDQVRVVRTGEVVLVPLPEGWRIDSYDMVTTRDTVVPPLGTTTTAGDRD